MVLKRLIRVVRDEGATGLVGRLRHPKPRARAGAVASIPHAVAVEGPDGPVRRGLEAALRRAGVAVVADPGGGLTVRIDPDLSGEGLPGTAEVLVLAGTGPGPGDPLPRRLFAAQAILDVSAERIARLSREGVPLARLFAIGADEEGASSGSYRFLVAAGAVPAERAEWDAFRDLRDLPPAPRLCISLPEAAERRAAFRSLGLAGFRTFDGIRLTPGWKGAAHSHRLVAQACLDQGIASATVCEDDLAPAPGFAGRHARVTAYLAGCDWDVFSGLVTMVDHRYRVTRVERRDGEVFVHLDRCIGMVFGILNRRALAWLAGWREGRGDSPEHAIDRHLERMPDLRVVTTLPFLVDHRDDMRSTVWGFRNGRYRSLIRASERRLGRLVAAFEAAEGSSPQPAVTAPTGPRSGTVSP